ncbi:MAG: zinc carboxypeptidase, partial [Bacteroidetes bacterium]|nr:zinc carboxypeptidase [Fibrella sp.]
AIMKEFGNFFDKASREPIGQFKTYVIKANGDEGRLTAIRQLLDRNLIRYGKAEKALKVTGFDYISQKTEKNVSVEAEDLVISAYQPKSTLLKILFEPKSALEDSATYDITAWALPYAYGLQTYGLTTRINPVAYVAPAPAMTTPTTSPQPYAYLAKWQSLPSVQLLAGLLKQSVKVRVNEKPFELEGQTYPAGTLLITRAGNERIPGFDALVQTEAGRVNQRLTPVQSGFVTKGSDFGSEFVMALTAPHVGVIVGDATTATAVGEIWHYFDQDLNYPVTLIDGNALGNVNWSTLDVLVLPTGYGYGRIMTDRNLTVVKEWVRAGGKLIAMERAAAFLAGKPEFELKQKETKDDKKSDPKKNPTDSLKRYEDRERTALSDETPGSIYRISLDTTHPLAFGITNDYYTLVQEAHNFDLLKDGWNVGYLKTNNYVAGFAGKNAKDKLRNTLSMGVQSLGRGTVVYLADDPLFRGFWYSGKLLFGNAVFMVP